MRVLPTPVRELTRAQSGVVSRRQLLELGARRGEIRSWIHHRLLAPRLPGVYVDHTGPVTDEQDAWAAVLWAEPAALFGASALAAHGLGPRTRADTPRVVHVVVGAGRKLVAPPGVAVHRSRRLDERVEWHRHPPRTRLEDAVIDVATAASDELSAIAVVAEAIGSRRTTAPRIVSTLARRTRAHRRAFLLAVLGDVAEGACSVLGVAYLREVERAHGLPTGGRQVRASPRGTVYRDVEYTTYGVVLELDGRLDHTDPTDRTRDLGRDLDATVDGRVTARLGWGQVFGGACRTAAAVATLLQRRGWEGRPRRCPSCG